MAMISPRDLYLRQHPTLAEIVASGDAARLRKFLTNHGGIASGWQRVMYATDATLQDPLNPDPVSGPSSNFGGQESDFSGGQAAPPAPAAPAAPAGPPPLSAGDQDWVDAMFALFKANGMDGLAQVVLDLVTQGARGSALTLGLQQSDPYRERFRANDARRAAGLRVLDPGEYLAAEAAYREILAPLPDGFHDQIEDFRGFIERGVSPKELSERVNAAVALARKTDPGYRRMLMEQYGIALSDGDIAAYFLDPGLAETLIDRQVQSVGVMDAARRHGLSYGRTRAEQLAELGVTGAQADQAFGQIAEATRDYGRAARAFGDEYTQTEAEDELLLGDSQGRRHRNRLESAVRAVGSRTGARATRGTFGTDLEGAY